MPAAHTPPDAPPASLLIVEDDPALAGFLAAVLQDDGHPVRTAGSRAAALDALAAERPCIVLLDLGLPPQPSSMAEGLTLLDDIVRHHPRVKVLILTGQDESAAALEAVRRGAFDFLIKPVALPTIRLALRRAELFAHQEARLAAAGEARLAVTARLEEGPREAAAAAEEQLVRRALAEAGYNIADAARRLGLAREHVYYYLKKYGIQRPG